MLQSIESYPEHNTVVFKIGARINWPKAEIQIYP